LFTQSLEGATPESSDRTPEAIKNIALEEFSGIRSQVLGLS
jgi:hypothetical protein